MTHTGGGQAALPLGDAALSPADHKESCSRDGRTIQWPASRTPGLVWRGGPDLLDASWESSLCELLCWLSSIFFKFNHLSVLFCRAWSLTHQLRAIRWKSFCFLAKSRLWEVNVHNLFTLSFVFSAFCTDDMSSTLDKILQQEFLSVSRKVKLEISNHPGGKTKSLKIRCAA